MAKNGYYGMVQDPDIFSVRRRRTRGDLIEKFLIAEGLPRTKREQLFTCIPDKSTIAQFKAVEQQHKGLSEGYVTHQLGNYTTESTGR